MCSRIAIPFANACLHFSLDVCTISKNYRADIYHSYEVAVNNYS